MELTRRNLGKLAVATGAAAAVGTAVGTSVGRPADAAATWKTTGTTVSALAGFDNQMKAFMQARGITGGQLAVTYKGRLVLARGYSTSTALDVQPTSLFRVASVSKTITAAAIMKLVQDGKLSLSTPVGNIVAITPPAGQIKDTRWSAVTVKRMLQHLGGFDRDVSGDPNFKDAVISKALGVPMELQHADEIKYMAGQKLDFAPGSKYAYSNFGYVLAGRVIEKVSGLSYQTYVQQKLLTPLKIKRMALGWSIAKHTGEMPYESQYTGRTVLDNSGATVKAPYGSFSMRIQDANGGWIASAPDLVKWAKMFDAGSSVLNTTSLSAHLGEARDRHQQRRVLRSRLERATDHGRHRPQHLAHRQLAGDVLDPGPDVLRDELGRAVQPPGRPQRQVVRRHRRGPVDGGERRDVVADARLLLQVLQLARTSTRGSAAY